MAAQTSAKQLYDLLVSRNFDPELLDSAGRPSADPTETEVFSFDFQTESGNDYGTVVVMLGDDNDMEIYFGDNIGRGMETDDKKEWFDFLYQLRMFAKRNLMTFVLKNINRLRYSMQGQAAIKEGLFESWTGTKTTSWNGKPKEARLMIKHKKAIGENDARFRYIESLFIETAEGERYKLPFNKLSGGRAMVEHVRNGGKPYDIRGQHISEMVNELNVLSRFKRANHGKVFEGDTAQLVEQTNAYYETAQRTLKSLSTKSGYNNYFESWNPAEVTEQEVVIEGLKHLFITQSIDHRIEEALPILARIQQGTEMKEANIFETWATQILEGTWATPDTPEKRSQLVALMNKEFPVGADATNATEQLYDLVGDDVLFDRLEELAQADANADARQVIYDRMQELADNPDIAATMSEFTVDTNTLDEPVDNVELDSTDIQSETVDNTQDYQQDLSSILKHAGVEPQDNPAPDYESEKIDEAASRKDFRMVADLLKHIPDVDKRRELAQHHAEIFAQQNPRFSKEKFFNYIGLELAEESNPGITPADIDGAPESSLEESDIDESRCNMTEAGESCPVHGLKECGSTTTPSLEESKKDPFIARIKMLSGM